jgi:hypothetical protein
MNSKRDLQQSVKLVGELHKNADWHTFHELTFRCRKLYAFGDAFTTHLHVRHLGTRLGEVLRLAQLQPIFEFLRYMRTTERRHWAFDGGQTARGFRWASDSRYRNIYIGVIRKACLLLFCGKFKDVDKWIQDDLLRSKVPMIYTISWF